MIKCSRLYLSADLALRYLSFRYLILDGMPSTLYKMKKAFLVCGFCALIFSAACSGKKTDSLPVEYSRILKSDSRSGEPTHRWFYFTDAGFKEIDVPRNAPKVQKKPWTEAVRITSSVLIDGTGYFFVNKLGLLVCPPASGMQKEGIASKTLLVKNPDFFSDFAAGSLFGIDNVPVFNLYTNSIFASREKNGSDSAEREKSDAVLIGYDKENRDFFPLLYRKDFPRTGKAELRELFFIDDMWYVLLKETGEQRTDFYAYSFDTPEAFTGMLRKNRTAAGTEPVRPNLIFKEIGVHEFRQKIRPLDASFLPGRLKALLEPVPSEVPWYLEYRSDCSLSPRRFVRREHAPNPRQAYAVSEEPYSAAFFEDGTFFFAGTLPMKHVVNEGKTTAFKLPRLSAGYTYSYALIAGSTLFAAWEETAFFETGRSGFVAVNLEKILYESED